MCCGSSSPSLAPAPTAPPRCARRAPAPLPPDGGGSRDAPPRRSTACARRGTGGSAARARRRQRRRAVRDGGADGGGGGCTPTGTRRICVAAAPTRACTPCSTRSRRASCGGCTSWGQHLPSRFNAHAAAARPPMSTTLPARCRPRRRRRRRRRRLGRRDRAARARGCARGSSGGGREAARRVGRRAGGGRNLWEGGRGMWHASREHVTRRAAQSWAGGWRLDVGRPTDDDGWQYAASWNTRRVARQTGRATAAAAARGPRGVAGGGRRRRRRLRRRRPSARRRSADRRSAGRPAAPAGGDAR